MEEIEFLDVETGEPILFYVLEETMLGGDRYLLVSDGHPDDDDEATAFIFRVVGDDGADMTYEEVEDERTLHSLSKIFEELVDDISLQ